MSRIDSLTQIRVRLTHVTTEVSPTSLERIRQAWAGVPMQHDIGEPRTGTSEAETSETELNEAEVTEAATVTEEPMLAPEIEILSFNNAIVHFDNLEAFVINEDALGSQRRTKVAERQAKSRASLKTVKAIFSIGTAEQQAVALRQALCHPDMRVAAKTAGFHDNVAAHFQNEQSKKMIRRALETTASKVTATTTKQHSLIWSSCQ
jgi:hypothetical protein